MGLAVVVADAGAVYPVRIDPTFSDSGWSGLGTGLNGAVVNVYALALDGSGNLYVGGLFTSAGGVSATNIAKWNGSVWSPLGSGINSTVTALAISGTNLYAGGEFTSAGGVANTKYIAKWNGSAWSALGSGMSANVYALAVSGTNLYAGGWFTSAGGTSANYVAKWNGNSWSALGSGMSGTPLIVQTAVYALAVSGTNLYAGGNFTLAGAVANTKAIAKWNGNAWSALGSVPYNTYDIVHALAVDGTNLYAGGQFPNAAGATNATGIAKWSGGAWSALGTGLGGVVQALAVDGSGNLYAGGWFTTAGGISAANIAQWDGTTWSGLGSGVDGGPNALAVSGTHLYAGGWFTTAGGKTVAHVAMALPAPPTTTTLASSLNPSIFGDSVTFTATVSPTNANGTVTFMDGATPFGTNTLSEGTATFTTAALSGGVHTLTAVYGGEGTNYSGSTSDPLSQTVIFAPTITTQPASQTVLGAGNAIYTTVSSSSTAYTNVLGTSAYGTASFSVTASSTSLAYQWYLGGTALAGQTASNLTVIASPTHAGDYTVVITNVAGAVTSSVATLTVDQPANSLAYAFDQAATGWQSTDWQITGNAYWATDGGYSVMTKRMAVTDSNKGKNGSFWFKPAPINPGQSWKFYWTFQGGYANNGPADQCSLVIQSDGTNASGSYTGKFLSILLDDYQNSGDPSASTLKVSYGTGASSTNFPFVNLATAFASANQAPGLSCVSSGANPPYNLSATYLAASNLLTVTIANATLASGAIGSTNNPLSYDYTINLASQFGANAGVVGFNAGTGGSAENHYILNASGLANFIAPVITSQPTNLVKNVGQSASFTVVAVGATSYQWYFGGAAIAGATNASYTIASVAMSQFGSYTVAASNLAGSVTSSPAILTSTTPYIAVQPASRVVSLGAATNLT
ncbi:MAG: Ig-like domain repeat protein, partial [Verrucomicrobiota bacterium]